MIEEILKNHDEQKEQTQGPAQRRALGMVYAWGYSECKMAGVFRISDEPDLKRILIPPQRVNVVVGEIMVVNSLLEEALKQEVQRVDVWTRYWPTVQHLSRPDQRTSPKRREELDRFIELLKKFPTAPRIALNKRDKLLFHALRGMTTFDYELNGGLRDYLGKMEALYFEVEDAA